MQAHAILSSPSDSSESTRSKSSRCNNYHLRPKGHLSRCRRRARYQVTLLDSGEIDVLHLCQACRNKLDSEIERGVIFEILDEAPVEELAFDSK